MCEKMEGEDKPKLIEEKLETNEDLSVVDMDLSDGEISNKGEDVVSLERKHFQRIVNAFQSYKLNSLRRLYRSTKYVSSLPERHQEFLKEYRAHLENVRVGIEHNYEIIKLILKEVAHIFENMDHSQDVKSNSLHTTPHDMDKVQSIFKQLCREWSVEGKAERDESFQRILDEIVLRFPKREINSQRARVLVPGAGLGRLPYEIAKRGFECEGNEFSLFMLFTSNFILNKCQEINIFQVYPWVHQYYNHLASKDQIFHIQFPDANPSELPTDSDFSMAAGNFIEIYTIPDSWDCVVTCFFLDTAHNVITYIETMWNILKPGGYWINLGPLLYHYADLPNEDSIEPSYEELKHIIEKIGFLYLKEETNIKTPYCQNPNSMMLNEFRSVFFVCQKPTS